jgi:hypothetical protein
MSEPMSEIQMHAARLGWIEGELAREHHRYASQLAVSTSAILDHYEPLAELGQAVLDEHRAALAHERDVTDPALKRAAYEAQQHAYKLREALL